MTQVVRLKPLEYIHVHDTNTSATVLIKGPATYTVMTHQQLPFQPPKPFVVVPPRHYCVVSNPILRDKATRAPVEQHHGQIKVALGEKEIRFAQEPFPLYPGEVMAEEPKPLLLLNANESVVCRALENVTVDKQAYAAGDQWLFSGPATYVPRVEVDIVERRDAVIVKQNQSLRLRARNRFTDRTGTVRSAGEEYLWTVPGPFTWGVDEQLMCVVDAVTLTDQKALHVRVTAQFTDTRAWANGAQRKPGDVYMVTAEDTPLFTPLTSEVVASEAPRLTLTRRQWAVILDPVGDDGVQHLGARKVVTDVTLFLRPGESLEGNTVRDVYSLSEDEALVLTAVEEFTDNDGLRRVPGDLWMIRGPVEYIPSAQVRVVPPRGKDAKGDETDKRRKIVLADNEGVYVRNTQTGEVRAVIGGTLMLSATEELWEKELPAVVEQKLAEQGSSHMAYIDGAMQSKKQRDRTRVVRYTIPHNAITQVYDYKKRTQRTLFGPDAVMLGPDEQFTVLSLSGSPWDKTRPNVCLPKQAGFIKALYIFLGPGTLSDVLNVETSDHARLQLQLSYDWRFTVETGNTKQADQCFAVPDFVGDCCSCIASRIRASVAAVPFDHFHKHSPSIVQAAVFGIDKATDAPRQELAFNANRLLVTSVDIQGIEVLDERTRIALQQSVKMAIEITTQSQETSARQEASVREQQARGRLEKQQIADKTQNEMQRKGVLQLETETTSIQSTGRAKAEAKARSGATEIELETSVKVAQVKADTGSTMDKARLEAKLLKQRQEMEHLESKAQVEVSFKKQMTDIESAKFQRTMDAVGKDTITALAKAGPELQAKLLKSLGLQGYLVTDGTNPINLFNAAQGMTGAPAAGGAAAAGAGITPTF